ncbi:CAX-interacting protein 4-like [Lolium rigidum]|uniref:CAX-interacting protein 4-like n=1 Tax=Lolium rigidum TaxID=89674 RepID=UPI001F5C55CA|nr:CAX-interacting protein 4-like [Lolium rigidum]
MPATAGRVRMPANNRVHSSAALQTHGIWQSAIGYDPYAPEDNKHQAPSSSVSTAAVAANETTGSSVNAYTSLQSLLVVARLTSNADDTRGACKKCGRVGHLTFQCRNFLSLKTIGIEDDILQASNEAEARAKFAEAKNKASDADEEGSDKDDDIDSDSSDSDTDPMLEKIIAERERAKSRRGKQSEELDKKTSRHWSSSTKVKNKDGRKKHQSSDQDSERDSDRKRDRKSSKRQRTHHRKDGESGEEGRRHRHHHKRRRHRRNAPDGDSAADRSQYTATC